MSIKAKIRLIGLVACLGFLFYYIYSSFKAPMDKGAVKVKKNRVLPLKVELLDKDGNPVTDADISAPPVLQVIYETGTPEASDVTDDALNAGLGTEGNEFEFTGSEWQYNLKTKDYSSSGTYTIAIVTSDVCGYLITNTYTSVAKFVIE